MEFARCVEVDGGKVGEAEVTVVAAMSALEEGFLAARSRSLLLVLLPKCLLIRRIYAIPYLK